MVCAANRIIAALESGKYEVKTSVVVTGPRGEGELNLGTGKLFREGDSVTCDGGHTTGVGDLLSPCSLLSSCVR